jgi:hypothetical protein
VKPKKLKKALNILLVIVIAAVLSSLTLLLLDSWIKYPFFIGEILTILVLGSIVSGIDVRFVVKFSVLKINSRKILNTLLVVCPLSLLVLNVINVQGGILQVTLTLLCTSVFSGYTILNIFGLSRRFSRLEIAVLSFVVSYAFTGFLTLAILPINKEIRTIVLLSFFVGLALFSAVKRREIGENQVLPRPESLARGIDSLALILVIGLYALYLSLLYPNMSLLPVDSVQHYGSSLVLWRTPEVYTQYVYLLSHLHESAIISLANAPATLVQTGLVTLNFITPLAFYAMAKSTLQNIDKRLPAISTIFFSTFSGLGWTYLAKLKLDGSTGSELNLLSLVNDKTYNNALYVPQQFIWYVPVSVSFTIVIVEFLLLRKLEIGKKSFLLIFSVLTVASCLTHVTEAVLFSFFLCFFAVLSRFKTLRIDDALLGSIIGFAFLDGFYAVLQFPLGKSSGFSVTIPLLITSVLVGVYSYRRLSSSGSKTAFWSKLKPRILGEVAIYGVTLLFLLGFLTWSSVIPAFHTDALIFVGSIPWFFWPIILGVVGLLSISSLHFFSEDFKVRRMTSLFVALIIFSLLFGRILTFINVNFTYTGYWEKRFTTYLLLACSILAPITFVRLHDFLGRRLSGYSRKIVAALLIGVVVVSGIQSTFMVVEQWTLLTDQKNLPSEQELKALNTMQDFFLQDPHAFALTLSSQAMLYFAAAPYTPATTQNFYTASSPEIPLIFLRAHNLTHAYLYMAENDFQLLRIYPNSWLARHLLPSSPIVYQSNKALVYNISAVSFPKEESEVALIEPFDSTVDPTHRWLYANDILSMSQKDYSIVYDLDPTIFSRSTLILPFDPPQQNIAQQSLNDTFSDSADWIPISGIWQHTAAGLQGGSPSDQQDAIILGSQDVQNFSASLNFKLMSGDPNSLNYISLIYDWENQNNYKYSGIMFQGDKGYAYFASNTNGDLVSYPKWPGLDTGMHWKFGDSFNLTISLMGKKADLYINGSKCLSTEGLFTGGKLGIRMTRFNQVLFTSLETNTFNSLHLRAVEDYLNYANTGGRLVVLNTNGYGYFADRLFTFSNKTIEAFKISDSDFVFPEKLKMDIISPRTNTEAVGYYWSDQNSSLYAVKEKVGSGEIVYLNVFPIIEAIKASSNKTSFSQILGRLLNPADVSIKPFRYVIPKLSSFQKTEMFGSVLVNTSSVLFPINLDIAEVQIVCKGNNVSKLLDVGQLQISCAGPFNIHSANLTLESGAGFYSKLEFSNITDIMADGNYMSVSASSLNGSLSKYDSVEALHLKSKSEIIVYARQPAIQTQGITIFRTLYASGETFQKTIAQGQDLRINGNTTIVCYLSDTYTWASDLDFSGSFERNPPVLGYDELSSIPATIFWTLIIAPAFLVTLFVLRKRRHSNKEQLAPLERLSKQ